MWISYKQHIRELSSSVRKILLYFTYQQELKISIHHKWYEQVRRKKIKHTDTQNVAKLN